MQVIRGLGRVGVMAVALASPAWATDAARSSPSPSKAAAARAVPQAQAPGPRNGAAPATSRATGDAMPSSQGPAIVAGSRSIDAAGLARAGRQVEATPATTIYEARLSDGTLELSDRPPTGAAAVERHSYMLPQDTDARRRAEAEREYWRRQAEGFERRQRDRDHDLERAQRLRASQTIVVQADPGRRGVYHGYGWMPPDVYGGFGTVSGVPPGAVQPVYSSSPGAVQGRSEAGFIGSGFPMRR